MFQKRLNDFRKQRSLMEMTSCVSVGNAMMSAEEISNTVASIDSMKVSQNMVKEQDAVERCITLDKNSHRSHLCLLEILALEWVDRNTGGKFESKVDKNQHVEMICARTL